MTTNQGAEQYVRKIATLKTCTQTQLSNHKMNRNSKSYGEKRPQNDEQPNNKKLKARNRQLNRADSANRTTGSKKGQSNETTNERIRFNKRGKNSDLDKNSKQHQGEPQLVKLRATKTNSTSSSNATRIENGRNMEEKPHSRGTSQRQAHKLTHETAT